MAAEIITSQSPLGRWSIYDKRSNWGENFISQIERFSPCQQRICSNDQREKIPIVQCNQWRIAYSVHEFQIRWKWADLGTFVSPQRKSQQLSRLHFYPTMRKRDATKPSGDHIIYNEWRLNWAFSPSASCGHRRAISGKLIIIIIIVQLREASREATNPWRGEEASSINRNIRTGMPSSSSIFCSSECRFPLTIQAIYRFRNGETAAAATDRHEHNIPIFN